LPRSLKASRKTSPCTGFGLFPDMECVGSVELTPSSALAEAVSGISPREDKATAMRVLSLSGEALGVVVGAGRFYADPEGFRLRSLSSEPLRGGGGDDKRGTLGRDATLHIPVCVRGRHGALRQTAFRVAAHGAVDADPKDRENHVGAEACPRPWVEKKADAATGGMFVR
jgi:hypothetical protein